MKVKLISTQNIKPSHSTPKHLRYLRASLFDKVNSPVLMPLIFFFSPQNKVLTTNDTILNQLKGSLPDTLSLFYPLAGRFKDKNHIECNDEGVPFVEAQVVDTCFDDFLPKAKVSQLDYLLPYDSQLEGYSRLLLAIQITKFPCGGLAIGVKMSHSISDAFSFFTFVKTWAAITKEKDHPVLLPHPYFEISKVFPPNKKDVQAEPDLGLIKVRPLTKRFMVNKDKLDAIKQKLYTSNYTATSNNKVPSLAIILSAFIWSRVKMACRASDSRPCQVFHAVNIRPIVTPPDQHYYFGNMVINAIAEPSMSLAINNASNTDILCQEFLDRMKKSINRIVRDDWIIREIRAGREDLRFMMEGFERKSRGEITLMGFSSLRSLPVYEADFGWCKPVWVITGSLVFKDFVILIPSGPSSQDIDAYISLSDEDMAKFESERVPFVCF